MISISYHHLIQYIGHNKFIYNQFFDAVDRVIDCELLNDYMGWIDHDIPGVMIYMNGPEYYDYYDVFSLFDVVLCYRLNGDLCYRLNGDLCYRLNGDLC